MEYNICPECKTENEPEYIYCKNCGAQLKQKETHRANTQSQEDFGGSEAYQSDRQYNADSFGGAYSHSAPEPNNEAPVMTDTIDGIPYSEMTVFTGKKAYQIMPKFCKMEITGSKITWCWPAAILSFIFGPLGASLWFFYRKMYKIAIIFAAVGIILSGIISGLSSQLVIPIDEQQAESFVEQDGTVDIFGIFEQIYDNLDYRFYVLAIIEQLSGILTLLISGLFGYHFYKQHAVKRILQYRASGTDARYYQFGLASIGGTSGGMLALGILIMVFSQNIIQTIANII